MKQHNGDIFHNFKYSLLVCEQIRYLLKLQIRACLEYQKNLEKCIFEGKFYSNVPVISEFLETPAVNLMHATLRCIVSVKARGIKA